MDRKKEGGGGGGFSQKMCAFKVALKPIISVIRLRGYVWACVVVRTKQQMTIIQAYPSSPRIKCLLLCESRRGRRRRRETINFTPPSLSLSRARAWFRQGSSLSSHAKWMGDVMVTTTTEIEMRKANLIPRVVPLAIFTGRVDRRTP